MLLEFQVGNFRSFRDTQKFSLRAAPLRANDGGLEEGNVFEANGCRLLKSKAIYGGNASGKSNLVKALSAFALMVSKSVSREGLAYRIWNDRFLLLTNWDDQPVFFQLSFIMDALTYRYGFQILNSKVVYEWLFGKGKDEIEDEYFMRTNDHLQIKEKYFAGSGAYTDLALSGENELFRPDSLFLTGAALNGNKFAANIRNLISSIILVDGVNDRGAVKAAIRDLDKGREEDKFALKHLLKAADTGIEDLELSETSNSFLELDFPKAILQPISNPDENQSQILYSFHSRYDVEGNIKEQFSVPFFQWESEGTAKLFGIGALVLKSLRQGRTMVIDEFDARFHPNLTLKIVQLFHSAKTNPRNAQLVFITHDSGLLRRADLRRDQICFVNKDRYGISSLRTLIEFKGVRKDASYEKEYLNGNYEGVPFLDEMDSVLTQQNVGEDGL